MERKVTKKKLTALLTVFVIIANLFAPYSVLAERASDEPYIEAKLHQVANIDLEKEYTNKEMKDWDEDTKNYYFDLANRKKGIDDAPYTYITKGSQSNVHMVTIDFNLKNVRNNVGSVSLCFKIDTSVLKPAYSGSKLVWSDAADDDVACPIVKTNVGTDLQKFGKLGPWDNTTIKTFDGNDKVTMVFGMNGGSTGFATEGQSIISMTFLLADGKTIGDIKPSAIALTTTSGIATGLTIENSKDPVGTTQHFVSLEGPDYLKFEGFAADDTVKVSSITVEQGLTDNTYYKTEAINFTGMNLKITYSDGKEKIITKDNMNAMIADGTISIAEAEKFAKADNKVTIKAGDKSCELPYLLPQSLAVTTPITNMPVEHGDPINFAGGVVTITYDDGTTTETIPTDSSLLTPDRTVADVDNKTVKFTYIDGKVTNPGLTLNVTDPVMGIEITKMPGQAELEYSENAPITAATGEIKTRLKSGKTGPAIPMNDPSVKLSKTTALLADCENVQYVSGNSGLQRGDLKITVEYTDPANPTNKYSGYTDTAGTFHKAEYTVLVNDSVASVEVTTQSTAINKWGTERANLQVTGAVATITTTAGHSFTHNISYGDVNFAGYDKTSLAEKEYTVTYGTVSTDPGKGLKLKLTDYITGITINKTQTPATNYNEALIDAHLSAAGVTYTPVYAGGTTKTAQPVTASMIPNYVSNPKAPTAYDDLLHIFNEKVTIQVPLYEYEGAPATKVFTKNDFNINVVDTVTGIVVTSQPNKVLWVWGETFDSDGLRFGRKYASGATETPGILAKGRTDTSVTNPEDNTTGSSDGSRVTLTPTSAATWTDGTTDKEIKITYIDQITHTPYTATFTVQVQDKLKAAVPDGNQKIAFYHGEGWSVGSGKWNLEYESGRTDNTKPLNSGTSFKFVPGDTNVTTRPTDAEYGTGNTVTKRVKATYTEGAVSKSAEYDITITNYVDTMVMSAYPLTPKKYVLNATAYDFANEGTTSKKDEVTVTWLNGKTEVLPLDSARLSLPALNTLTITAETNIPVTVTLTDGAGNNIKDKADNDVTTTFLIDVGDGLIGSSVTGDMNKKAYNVGDNLDLTGLSFHEQYGSTPAGDPGKEITYPNSKITVQDKATGAAFTTDLPETAFDATTHTATRTVVITFTPDTSDSTFTKKIEKTVTIYNQVTGVTKHTNPKANYSLNEAMGTVEVEVQRAAKKADGTASSPDIKALSSSDFTPAFSTGTPGPQTISYTYVDNGYIGADGNATPNTVDTLTYNYTVADAITKVEMVDGMTDADKNYNHTETPDFSKLEIYTKLASDTDATSKGNRVQFADAVANGQITVKVTFKASEGAVDVTNDLSKITKLDDDLFDTTHWATVPVKVTFKADPSGGEGVNNKAEVNFDIRVYDVIDKIEIQAPLGDDPKKYIIGEEVTYPVGKYKVIRKSGQADPTEPNITKEMLDALSQSINTSAATTTPVTVTVTHKERDAHGTEIGYPDTFKYTVADVITKIDVKTPAPKVTAKLGKPLTEDDLAGLYINIYKGDPDTPAGDPVKVTTNMVKGLDTSTLGEKNVTIEYGQDADGNPVTVPFTIEVVDWIESIKVTAPTDDEYEVGENMDLSRRKNRIRLEEWKNTR